MEESVTRSLKMTDAPWLHERKARSENDAVMVSA